MSKKYKRQVRKETSGPEAASATSNSPASRATSSSLPVFNPDYTHIIKDLRRIGLLAGTFITILVILSFFVR
jgi:hypothetical protein